jgi:hypothetical protein
MQPSPTSMAPRRHQTENTRGHLSQMEWCSNKIQFTFVKFKQVSHNLTYSMVILSVKNKFTLEFYTFQTNQSCLIYINLMELQDTLITVFLLTAVIECKFHTLLMLHFEVYPSYNKTYSFLKYLNITL